MKPMRVSMLRMKGWWRLIQTSRARATSGRFCSAARRSFFLCQAEAAQVPPDRGAVRLNAVPVTQFHHQFIQRQVALFLDPALDPARHACQLAMPAAVALRLGIKRPGPALQQHHVVDKSDGNPEPSFWPGLSPVECKRSLATTGCLS